MLAVGWSQLRRGRLRSQPPWFPSAEPAVPPGTIGGAVRRYEPRLPDASRFHQESWSKQGARRLVPSPTLLVNRFGHKRLVFGEGGTTGRSCSGGCSSWGSKSRGRRAAMIEGSIRRRVLRASSPASVGAFSYCLLFSRSVVSDSLRSRGLQHARLLCPSPTPRACSNSCPSSRWCHLTISSSVVPFFLPSIFPYCLYSVVVFSLISLPLMWVPSGFVPPTDVGDVEGRVYVVISAEGMEAWPWFGAGFLTPGE